MANDAPEVHKERPLISWVLRGLLALGIVFSVWAGVVQFGSPGVTEHAGEPSPAVRDPEVLAQRRSVRAAAASRLDVARGKSILFGDLHVHTTFSVDAFLWGLPLLQGQGAHPPADACDFARFCSGLDFWSINDHAESLTPRRWSESREAIERCNQVSDDTMAFLGWEWTQVGLTPETHFGHRNVVLLETAEDRTPTRPIAAGGPNWEAIRGTDLGIGRFLLPLADWENRQRAYDLDAYMREIADVPLCPKVDDVRANGPECSEQAETPRELFERLDQWGHRALVIPHGTSWGSTAPRGASWEGQLDAGHHDPKRERLIEVYSGHGNSEEYREWRGVVRGPDGDVCPAVPSADHLASCTRAGEIIYARCKALGEDAAECEARAASARALHVAAGMNGHGVVPGARPADWLDAGQCRDCFMPAFDYRPAKSIQAALAQTSADGTGRYRFGLIASSDNHSARPGTGYKEVGRVGMTDQRALASARLRGLLAPEHPDPPARAEPVEFGPVAGGGESERMASFWQTGGLVAVHATERSRPAVFDALERRETYGTSGPKILLWFDALSSDGRRRPMGSVVAQSESPRFEVRAVGALRQLPGCPADVVERYGAEAIERVCLGECDHPSGEREIIDRIEVVRIRPRRSPGESLAEVIEDPWRVLPCPGSPDGCSVTFEDPGFADGGRDAVYYVRAIQRPTDAVNGANLRCDRASDGRCVSVDPCWGDDRTDRDDDCLAPIEERAWSSPIFVDHAGAISPALRSNR